MDLCIHILSSTGLYTFPKKTVSESMSDVCPFLPLPFSSVQLLGRVWLFATPWAAALDSEGPFLDPATRSREPQGETKLEQMDQSDSESDCSMDTSEVSLDCERMEQTDSSCGNSRHVESNVWQKRVLPGSLPVSYLYSIRIPHVERFGEALFNTFVTVLTQSLLSVLFCL